MDDFKDRLGVRRARNRGTMVTSINSLSIRRGTRRVTVKNSSPWGCKRPDG